MFEVLVESGAHPRAGLGPRLTSVVVHGGIIALAAAGVIRTGPIQPPKPVAVPIDIYAAPTRTQAAPPAGGISIPGTVVGPPATVPVDGPPTMPPISSPIGSPLAGPSARDLAGRDLFGSGHVEATEPGGSILLAGEVDEPVTVLVPARLVYPAAFAAAGIEGEVRIEFVVDTAGRCEPGTLRVVSSSHSGFEASARSAVCEATYRPGRVRGRPVRQLVQQKVAFRQR